MIKWKNLESKLEGAETGDLLMMKTKETTVVSIIKDIEGIFVKLYHRLGKDPMYMTYTFTAFGQYAIIKAKEIQE